MKTRQGFVSNSSSSSFVCDVSGESYEGWDGDYGDIHECNCLNGHSFASDYLIEISETIPTPDKRAFMTENADEKETIAFKSVTDEQIEKWWEEDDWIDEYENNTDQYWELPEQRCPICTFQKPCDRDILTYLLKDTGLTKESILKSLRETFSSYRDFLVWTRKGL